MTLYLPRKQVLGSGQEILVEVITRWGSPNNGGSKVAELPVNTTGFFERRLDATSVSKLSVALSPRDITLHGEHLAKIESYAHEIRVWWDGIVAWVGPVTHVRYRWDGIDITALDLTAHWETRTLGEHIHNGVDMSTIFADYHRDAYNQDSWGMAVVAKPTGLRATREVLRAQGMVASRALDELSRTGIDWTAIGRTLHIGGEEVPSTPIATLKDQHFTTPLEIVDDGVNRATDVVVSGDGVSGQATLNVNSPHRKRYGLITARSQEQNIIDQASAQTAAKTRLDFFQNPIRIDPGNALLTPSAPIPMNDLVPGARIDMEAARTIKKVKGMFRLSRVRANFDGTVAISTQPLGTVTPGT